MTVEPSYVNRGCRHMSVCDSVVPDTRLQTLADAWDAYREDGGTRYSEAMDNFVGVIIDIVEDNNG